MLRLIDELRVYHAWDGCSQVCNYTHPVYVVPRINKLHNTCKLNVTRNIKRILLIVRVLILHIARVQVGYVFIHFTDL